MDLPLKHSVSVLATAAILSACAGYNQSSIPSCPVRISIYSTGLAAGDYYRMDAKGYHYSTEFLNRNPNFPDPFKRPPTDANGNIATDQYAYGYAGVVVYYGTDGNYAAYDLCCPKCLDATNPLVPHWTYLDCPNCGEKFDVTQSGSGGTGIPKNGICKEGLKRYSVSYNPNTYTIEVYN